MIRVALLSLLCSGCWACLDWPENAPANPPPYEAEVVDQVEDLVGVDLDGWALHWVEGPCIVAGQAPDPDEHCARGLTYDDGRIYVVRRFSVTISALIHEAIHVKLYQETGSLDSHHRDPMWSTVRDLKDQLWRWECPLLYPGSDACPEPVSTPHQGDPP